MESVDNHVVRSKWAAVRNMTWIYFRSLRDVQVELEKEVTLNEELKQTVNRITADKYISESKVKELRWQKLYAGVKMQAHMADVKAKFYRQQLEASQELSKVVREKETLEARLRVVHEMTVKQLEKWELVDYSDDDEDRGERL